MKRWNLYLGMYDEGAAVVSGSVAETLDGEQPQAGKQVQNMKQVLNTGVDQAHAAGEQAETHLASGTESASPEELEAKFEELISGEYKKAFDGRVQKIINSRFKDVGTMKTQLKESQELLNLIGSKYGITDGNAKAIQKAIEEDSSYWEDAAAAEGISVEQYKRMRKLESENLSFKRAKEEAEQTMQRQRMYEKWDMEAEQLKNFYPGFNLSMEVKNPQFTRLLGVGIDMRTAFETIHHDEILSGAMALTAKKIAKKQADTIRSRQERPVEGAAGDNAAFVAKTDMSKMSRQEIMELARRARAGEIIPL